MSGARYVIGLALGRLGRRGGGAVGAALGIAAAAAVLAGIMAGGTIAEDRSVAQDVERLRADTRAVRATWFGVPVGDEERWTSLDRAARDELAALPVPAPTRIALVRESTIGGVFVGLAAVDGLEPHVVLRSGRLPARCRPARCEVLRLRGRGPLPDVSGLRVVEVGTATLRSRQLFGDFLAPTDNALADAELAPGLARSAGYHRPPPGPLVVAEGVAGLVESPVLERSYRSYGWVQPLAPGTPRLWEIDGLVGDADRARAALQSRSSSWSVILPVEELRASEQDANVAGQRLLLVGGEAAALLFAFSVLAAGSLRRDLLAARRRLTWHGATTAQRALLTATECVVVGFGGAVVGWLVGALGGAMAARLANAPVTAVLRESVLSPGGILLGLAVGVVAALVIGVTVTSSRVTTSRLGPLELAAVAALLAAGGVVASGAVEPEELARGGAAPVVLLLVPGLVVFAGAVGAARALPVVGRFLSRRRGRTTRLAGVSLARGSGAAGIATAFLALAIGLATFAETYRATLARGERDRAAYAVPTDVIVRENLRALVAVLRAAPLERYAAITGVETAQPVVRLSASAGPAASVSGVTVLGLPAEAVERLPLWRAAWGTSHAELVEAIRPTGSTTLRGSPIRGRELRLAVDPGILSFQATIKDRAGGFRVVDLGAANARQPSVLTARLPEPARGGTLISISLVPPRLQDRGADAGVAVRGTTRLRVLGASLDAWLGQNGVTVGRPTTPGELRVTYAVTRQRDARVRARQPTDDRPVTAVVTKSLGDLAGGVGGTLPLVVGGESIAVRVAAVVERLPGTVGDAVLVERDALTTAADAEAPGRAEVSELWLDVEPGRDEEVAAALVQRPFAVLATSSRAELVADAGRDPLAHGTLLALVAAALAALALAVAGLVLAVRADLRDDRGELAELEAEGAGPRTLRRVLAGRAAVLALVGALVGLLTGGVLALLVTRVVSVTARGDLPEPPLVTAVDPLVLAVAAAAVALAAALLVMRAASSAFASERGPGRIGGQA